MKKTFTLPNHLKKLMREICDIIEEDEFILYGGTPLDLLLNNKTKIHDLDIVIAGIDKGKIRRCREKIKEKGFEIIESSREYYIHKNKKVVLVYAQNDKLFLDIAFLHDPELIGHFNLETLFFRHPQMDYVDQFDTLKGVREKSIKLVRDLEAENPYLLLGRFLRLCSKYDIPLSKYEHKKILLDIKEKLKEWEINSNFNKSAYLSCISSLFKSIIQSRDKGFNKVLINSSVLKSVFPELGQIINVYKDEFVKNMSRAKTKLDIVILFDKYLNDLERKIFRGKIKALKTRQWDEQDIRCSRHFN